MPNKKNTVEEKYEEVQQLRHQLELENAYLRQEHRLKHGHGRIVGESAAIMEVLGQVEQVAPTATTILIVYDPF